MKKLFHRSTKYNVESLTLNSLKKRWRDRCARYEAMHLIELEEKRKEEREEKLRLEKFQQQRAERLIRHNQEVDVNEQNYSNICNASTVESTSPLLLNTVFTPVTEQEAVCTCSSDTPSTVITLQCKEQLQTARYERNQALSLAQHYRNIAEERQSEKRILKNELEGQIEVVRNFWRNKVVEGSSRSGRILRAALIRK